MYPKDESLHPLAEVKQQRKEKLKEKLEISANVILELKKQVASLTSKCQDLHTKCTVGEDQLLNQIKVSDAYREQIQTQQGRLEKIAQLESQIKFLEAEKRFTTQIQLLTNQLAVQAEQLAEQRKIQVDQQAWNKIVENVLAEHFPK